MSTIKKRVFTCYLNGDDRHDKLETFKDHVAWYIGQDETGRLGMEHIQITFGFKNARSLSGVQRALENANIQIADDPEKCIKYCTDEAKREGQLYSWGDIPNFSKRVNKSLIDEALTLPSYEEAMKHIEDTDKLFYLQNQKKLCLYFTQKYDSSDKGLYPAEAFNKPLQEVTKKVIVLVGPTGLGKTQYALAHFKKPLHVKDKEDWRRYNDTTDGIILDDLDFPSWSPLTLLKLLDMETPITQNIKYGATRIKAGTPRIICVNHMDLFWPRTIHAETIKACERRINIIEVNNPLFNPKTPPIFNIKKRQPPTPQKQPPKKTYNCELCNAPGPDRICKPCSSNLIQQLEDFDMNENSPPAPPASPEPQRLPSTSDEEEHDVTGTEA